MKLRIGNTIMTVAEILLAILWVSIAIVVLYAIITVIIRIL